MQKILKVCCPELPLGLDCSILAAQLSRVEWHQGMDFTGCALSVNVQAFLVNPCNRSFKSL